MWVTPAEGVTLLTGVDIQLVCKYKLDKQIAAQSRAFFNGLADIIDPKCEDVADATRLTAQGCACLTSRSSR